jgi:CBS domain-containing protein
MKVRDLMTSDVKTCRPETNLAEAVRDMWEGDFGAMPIVNDEGRVTGVITDRDICIAVATRGRSADRIAVREVAQGHAYTCLPEDDAAVALQTMKAHKVRRLPVVDADGHVRGILSLNDVVTHAGAASPTEVVSTLAGICEHRRPVAIAGAA